MIISTVCFILTFAVYSSIQKEPKLNFYRIRDDTDNGVLPPKGRWKRSIISLGFSALQYITKGATKLFVTEFGEVFVKRGGFQQALKDFDSIVDPADVGRNFKVKGVVVRKVGVVGDRTVIYDKGSPAYPPKLTIRTSNTLPGTRSGFEKDIIFYKNGNM